MNTNLEENQSIGQVQYSVEAFKDLLHSQESDEMKQGLTEMYFNYSQFLLHHPDEYRYEAKGHLFYLIQLIEVLGSKKQ